jgi:hypothetical protein
MNARVDEDDELNDSLANSDITRFDDDSGDDLHEPPYREAL